MTGMPFSSQVGNPTEKQILLIEKYTEKLEKKNEVEETPVEVEVPAVEEPAQVETPVVDSTEATNTEVNE